MVPTHTGVPGVQSHARHAPPLHDWPAAQGDESQPSPSAEQVSTAPVAPEGQRVVPGAQTRGRHTPSRQPSVEPHGTTLRPWPSASHTLRALAEEQVAEPGVHVHGVQALLAARHAVIAAHAVGVDPRPSGLHWRRVVRPAQA